MMKTKNIPKRVVNRQLSNRPTRSTPVGWTILAAQSAKHGSSSGGRKRPSHFRQTLTDPVIINSVLTDVLAKWERSTMAKQPRRQRTKETGMANAPQADRGRKRTAKAISKEEDNGLSLEKVQPHVPPVESSSSRSTRRSRRSAGGVVEFASLAYTYGGMDWDPLFKCWIPKKKKQKAQRGSDPDPTHGVLPNAPKRSSKSQNSLPSKGKVNSCTNGTTKSLPPTSDRTVSTSGGSIKEAATTSADGFQAPERIIEPATNLLAVSPNDSSSPSKQNLRVDCTRKDERPVAIDCAVRCDRGPTSQKGTSRKVTVEESEAQSSSPIEVLATKLAAFFGRKSD